MANGQGQQDDIQITGGGGAAPAAQGAAVPTAPQAKKPTPTFDLNDEALFGAAQTVAPPDKYKVPKLVSEKFPDLVDLIKNTESMNEDERDYWFQILPIMTEDQIAKFRDILLTEKNQLDKLDKEYEEELTKLNEKHMIEWKEFETKEKREEIAGKEKKAEVEEKAEEEELLKRLQEI
ncbi:hypothetical protein KJ835_00250 [Patescibacteria group bacterium]|nr:hypothetical protein [Patescibacteria group bacterium]